MPHPFTHPSSKKLLGEIFSVFQTTQIFQRTDRHIVFLCGGPIHARSHSLRKRFLNFICGDPIHARSHSLRKRFLNFNRENPSKFRLFIAEAATKDLSQHNKPEFLNIADFETFLADIADCILIFPESAGSIAEVAYFSNNDETIKKILVVNDINKQDDSFINLGPIEKINRNSEFRPVILTDYKNPNFNQIKIRITARLPITNPIKFQFLKYNKLTLKQRLYVVFQFIYIFRALTIDGLIHCLSKVFEYVRKKELKHLLSLLIAAEYVSRKGDDSEYFIPSIEVEPFLEFRKFDLSDLQAATALYFKKHHQESYDILRRKV